MAYKLPLEELRRIQHVVNAVDVLRPLSRDEVNELALHLTRRSIQPGLVFARQGERVRHIHFIQSGTVKAVRRNFLIDTVEAELGAAQIFGVTELWHGRPHAVTMVGGEAGDLYALPVPAFRELLLANETVRHLLLAKIQLVPAVSAVAS